MDIDEFMDVAADHEITFMVVTATEGVTFAVGYPRGMSKSWKKRLKAWADANSEELANALASMVLTASGGALGTTVIAPEKPTLQ